MAIFQEAQTNATIQRNKQLRKCSSIKSKQQSSHIGRKKSNKKNATKHPKSRQGLVGFPTKSIKGLKISRFNKRMSTHIRHADYDQRIESLRVHLRQVDKENYEKLQKIKYRSVQRSTGERCVSIQKSPRGRYASTHHSSRARGYSYEDKSPGTKSQRNSRTPKVEPRISGKRTKEIYRTLDKTQKIKNIHHVTESPKPEHKIITRSANFKNKGIAMSPKHRNSSRKTPKLRPRSFGYKGTPDSKIKTSVVAGGSGIQNPSTGATKESMEQWLQRIESTIFDTNKRLFGPNTRLGFKRIPRRNIGSIVEENP